MSDGRLCIQYFLNTTIQEYHLVYLLKHNPFLISILWDSACTALCTFPIIGAVWIIKASPNSYFNTLFYTPREYLLDVKKINKYTTPVAVRTT